MFVVVDAVLDGPNEAVGHGPPGVGVEADRSEVLDPRVELDVAVASGFEDGLGPAEESSPEPGALMRRRHEEVYELVVVECEVPDRLSFDCRHLAQKCRTRSEPRPELLGGSVAVGGFECASVQLAGEGLLEAALVIRGDCVGIVGSCAAHLERHHGGSVTQIAIADRFSVGLSASCAATFET